MHSYFLFAEAASKDFQWGEQLSWGANILLAIFAGLALRQVSAAVKQAQCALDQNRIALDQLKLASEQLEVSRADLVLRSRRESIAVALEQCKRFADTIIPHFHAVGSELAAKHYNFPTKANPDFPFHSKEADPVGAKLWTADHELRMKIICALNELESFAMYFASDLADESVAFTPTAGSYCQFCENFGMFIGVFRQPEHMKLFQNLVKLYGIWKPRLERTVLEEQVKLLESKKQLLPPDKKGTPVGTVPSVQ